MVLSRHVPEVRGVLTLHCDADGWRAELQQGGSTALAPLPAASPAAAIHDLGLDEAARWATDLASAACRRQAATRPG